MSVAIRLTRKGRKKKPFYRIIAIDRRARRDGRPIEDLGWYDPFTKKFSISEERIEEWVKLGAKVSDRVNIILGNKVPYLIKPTQENKEDKKEEENKEPVETAQTPEN